MNKHSIINNPDMVVGCLLGEEAIKPNWYKVFIMANTESKVIQHECLYEGTAAYQKLYDHVIVAQITVKGQRKEGDTFKDIENTPTGTYISYLQPRQNLIASGKIWRYLTYFKFEDLIKSHSLYFTRLDQFPDKLEGVSPYSCIKAILADKQKNEEQRREAFRLYKIRMENNRKVGFACCWHINDEINYDMWENYGQNSTDSICIETNVNRLKKVLEKSQLPFLEEPVQYFDEPYFNQNAYWFPSLFKRGNFKYEREFRSILFVHGFDIKGVKININPAELIRRIYIHPNASKEFFKQIRGFIKSNGLSIPIAQIRPKDQLSNKLNFA
jgi:hypothetical protein